jgi:hypothetical protein
VTADFCIGNYYHCPRRCADRQNCKQRSMNRRVPLAVFQCVGQAIELEHERKASQRELPFFDCGNALKAWTERVKNSRRGGEKN